MRKAIKLAIALAVGIAFGAWNRDFFIGSLAFIFVFAMFVPEVPKRSIRVYRG